jgi:hypothetical protein
LKEKSSKDQSAGCGCWELGMQKYYCIGDKMYMACKSN